MGTMTRIAFLGPEGTYTHQAVLQEFGQSIECTPQKSIAACFEQLDQKNVDFAVVPLENSTNGQVVFTYDLLRDWFMTTTPGFSVVAEQFVSINHCLFSNASSLSKVEKVYSHPQVWGQVSDFLQREKFNGNCDRIDCGSTAQAAELVATDDSNTSACISSKMGGERLGLRVVEENIEDLKGNTTRFLVLGREESKGGTDSAENERDTEKDTENERDAENEKDSNPTHVTSVVLILNDNDPGALCTALNAFKQHDINLTSITSRPSQLARWEYVFFLEAEGRHSDLGMKSSIELLQNSCKKVAVLGLFKRSWRYNGKV